MSFSNRLCYGDCLAVMDEMPAASIDLIYLDPPFNSERDYSALYKDETGRPLPDSVENFSDMWRLDEEREACLQQLPDAMRREGIDENAVAFWQHWIEALRGREPSMLAYLSYMAERLLAMRKLLKPDGSLYYHCDPTASHYVKVMLDSLFGRKNFRNEIIWCYTGPGSPRMRQFNRKHDVIFWYSNGESWTFNKDNVRIPHKDGGPHAGGFGAGGKRPDDPVYGESGKVPESWWNDIAIAPRSSKEYLGYATQKPLALLRRIIAASSNTGERVLDPFCGSATTLEAAHSLERQWIGIDNGIHAIEHVARRRLEARCGLHEGTDYHVEGVPRDVQAAKALWQSNPSRFRRWAIECVEGFMTTKREGRVYFSTSEEKQLQSMLLAVGEEGIDEGIAALQRDDALLLGVILPQRPSDAQHTSLQSLIERADCWELQGVAYPRVQSLSIEEILEGKRFLSPARARPKLSRAAE